MSFDDLSFIPDSYNLKSIVLSLSTVEDEQFEIFDKISLSNIRMKIGVGREDGGPTEVNSISFTHFGIEATATIFGLEMTVIFRIFKMFQFFDLELTRD